MTKSVEMAKVVLLALLGQVEIKSWGGGLAGRRGRLWALNFLFFHFLAFHSRAALPAYHSRGQNGKLEVSEAEGRALQTLTAKGDRGKSCGGRLYLQKPLKPRAGRAVGRGAFPSPWVMKRRASCLR